MAELMMQKEFTIALVPGVVSLIVASIAFWRSTRISRRQVVTQKAIVAFQAAAAEAQPVLEAISGAWANMQKIKHSLDILLLPTRAGLPLALDDLGEAVDHLTSGFVAHGSRLPEYLAKVWHDAKNYGRSLNAAANMKFRDLKVTDPLPDDARDWVMQNREIVSSLQVSLQNGRENYRKDLVDTIGGLLHYAERRVAVESGAELYRGGF